MFLAFYQVCLSFVLPPPPGVWSDFLGIGFVSSESDVVIKQFRYASKRRKLMFRSLILMLFYKVF